MLSHIFAGEVPDGEQYALSVVVARSIGMWLAEVSNRDRTIYGRNNF